MKRIALITLFFLTVTYTLNGLSVKTIVDEMNIRYNKIMERAGTIKITQVIKSVSDDAEVTSIQTVLKKGTRYKIETVSRMALDEEKIKNIILFDGKDVWFISPFVGVTMMPRDEALVQGIFDDFSKLIPINSVIIGEEKINSEDCYVIKTPAQSGEPLKKIWISKTRFVPLKALGYFKKSIITLIFTEYKKIKEIWGIPYKTETMIDNKPVATTIVESVETGIKIVDETFEVRVK